MTDSTTVLESAARTATATSGVFKNRHGRGMIITLNTTAVAATPNISAVAVQIPCGGNSTKFKTIASWTGLTIATADVQHAFCLYPGAASAGGYTAAPVQGPAPRYYRIVVTHDDGDSITYSVAVDYLP